MSSPQEAGFWGDLGEDNLPPVPSSPTPEASVSGSASGSGSPAGSGSPGGSGSSSVYGFPRNLTKEQVCYFQNTVAACLSRSELRRQVGHTILIQDVRVQGVMCLLAPFIYRTMCINIAEENMKYLVYIMRMISALLDNTDLNLDKHIHLMVPGPLGCLLADQISTNPGAEDHWSVRTFANKIILEIMERYPCTKSIIINCYDKAVEAKRLETVYGAVIGLGRMGEEVVRKWLLPHLKSIAERIEPHIMEEKELSSVSLKTLAAKYITDELLDICGPLLAEFDSDEDDEDEEQEDLTDAFYLLGLAEESD